MLSIFLATKLEETMKDLQDVAILQFFCDNKDEKRNTAIAIIRVLIFQLVQRWPKLIDHILPSFEIQKGSLFDASSLEVLWRIFQNMIRDPIHGTIYCILDGLDECESASAKVLLIKFATLMPTKSNNPPPWPLNLVVVSRALPEFILQILSGFPRIRLDPDAETEVNGDIHRFIEVRVDELSSHKRYPELLCEYVEKVFRERAQGTFLWVGIVARMLRKYPWTQVEKALGLFPSGLDELYARILLQIDESQ